MEIVNDFLVNALQPISSFESALIKSLEQDYGFEAGALSNGNMGLHPSDINIAVWTRYGGVVASRNESLYTLINKTVTDHKGQNYIELENNLNNTLTLNYLTAPFSLDVLLYHPGTDYLIPQDNKWEVEEIDPLEFYPDNDDPEVVPRIKHIYGVRDGSTVVARAWCNYPRDLDGFSSYAIGVGTHVDHRGKGLGKAVVSALLERVTKESGIPLWNCQVSNLASLKLARSVGFQECAWTVYWNESNGYFNMQKLNEATNE